MKYFIIFVFLIFRVMSSKLDCSKLANDKCPGYYKDFEVSHEGFCSNFEGFVKCMMRFTYVCLEHFKDIHYWKCVSEPPPVMALGNTVRVSSQSVFGAAIVTLLLTYT
ncbi:uncharacterized protein LOC128249756 isoform X2 [Octopus bimaculoides]|uniref:uncharacterized protein LOC128249756 isoform X2 n=1 Tax=Octopus bimaculoides TaxID=37653 RepID=UPI0022E4DEEE|nr:uncharacterized protein LOC128249756 isoform X2 [Octopus bimaculoides]